jgi:hypothetical protein
MRVYFDTSIGIEGYALAEDRQDAPQAVVRSIARRTGEYAHGMSLDSWDEQGRFANYEATLTAGPVRANGAVPYRNVWVTIYTPEEVTE